MTVTEFKGEYREATDVEPPVSLNADVPAHLSIELGHFYPEDLTRDYDDFVGYFRRIGRHTAMTIENYADRTGIDEPRVSMTMMADDYRKLRDQTPQQVIGELLLPAAEEAGLRVDYISREAACAEYTPDRRDEISPARVLLARVIDLPRPAALAGVEFDKRSSRRGWICNGSPRIEGDDVWQPATEYGAQLHSMFMDVEIFSEDKRGRIWACPFLASVWQAARLGDLHHTGMPAMAVRPAPRDITGKLDFGDNWDGLPAVMQTNADAPGFEAYGTYSVLPHRYLSTEASVRAILGQVMRLPTSNRIEELAAAEGITLPTNTTDRIEYAFTRDF